MRTCYCCGSERSYYDTRHNCYLWYLNHDKDGNVLCINCRNKYDGIGRGTPEWRAYRKEQGERTICFKGKLIILPFKIPRKRKCEWCGRRGKTHTHHTKYDNSDPMKYTVQICPSCHAKEGFRLGQLVNVGNRNPYRDQVNGRYASKPNI